MEQILEHWEIIVAIVSPLFAYITGRKLEKIKVNKEKSNAEALHLENIDKIFKIQSGQMNNLVKDFNAEKKRIRVSIDEFRQENENLQTLLTNKQNIIDEQNIIIDKQKKIISETKKLLQNCNRLVNRYKRKYSEI